MHTCCHPSKEPRDVGGLGACAATAALQASSKTVATNPLHIVLHAHMGQMLLVRVAPNDFELVLDRHVHAIFTSIIPSIDGRKTSATSLLPCGHLDVWCKLCESFRGGRTRPRPGPGSGYPLRITMASKAVTTVDHVGSGWVLSVQRAGPASTAFRLLTLSATHSVGHC